MTTETLTTHRSLIAGIGDALVNAYVKLSRRSPAARCAEEAERLFALSDAELAKLGLTRDRVIHHAFRQYLHLS
jgi:hypothetical protein